MSDVTKAPVDVTKILRETERRQIVAWLRRGGNEQRARGCVAFEEGVMPLYNELADQIERGDHL